MRKNLPKRVKWRLLKLLKCLNPSCNKEAKKPSKFCCDACRIHFECMQNPRPSSEELERKTILKIYLNCTVLPNIPDKNLSILDALLEKALEISENKGIPQAKQFMKTQLERIRNANKR